MVRCAEAAMRIHRVIIFLLAGFVFFGAIALLPTLSRRAVIFFMLGGSAFFLLALASLIDRRWFRR